MLMLSFTIVDDSDSTTTDHRRRIYSQRATFLLLTLYLRSLLKPMTSLSRFQTKHVAPSKTKTLPLYFASLLFFSCLAVLCQLVPCIIKNREDCGRHLAALRTFYVVVLVEGATPSNINGGSIWMPISLRSLTAELIRFLNGLIQIWSIREGTLRVW